MVKAKHLLQENESALALASLQEKLGSAQKEKLLQENESALALAYLQEKLESVQKENSSLLYGAGGGETFLGKGTLGGRIYRKRILNQSFIIEKIESRQTGFLGLDEDQTFLRHSQLLCPLHVYKEGIHKCLVFENMEITGSFTSNILNHTTSRKELNLWRFISQLAGGLKYLHTHRRGAIPAQGLNPDSLQGSITFDFDIRERGIRWKLFCPPTIPGNDNNKNLHSEFSAANDILSLGCLLVFRLTKGHRLSTPMSSSELMRILPSGYSPSIYNLLSRMVHPLPGQRPTAKQIEQATFEEGRQEIGELVILPNQVDQFKRRVKEWMDNLPRPHPPHLRVSIEEGIKSLLCQRDETMAIGNFLSLLDKESKLVRGKVPLEEMVGSDRLMAQMLDSAHEEKAEDAIMKSQKHQSSFSTWAMDQHSHEDGAVGFASRCFSLRCLD